MSTEPVTDAPTLTGSKAAAIFNLTVRLLSQYTWRGPTRARTFFNENMVTVVLQETLTKAELTLVERDHDIAVETFILAPSDHQAPPPQADAT